MDISIRIKPGHKIDGEGESLGQDLAGRTFTFWRSQPCIDVPLDVAIRLENEVPQRFEIVDRDLAVQIKGAFKYITNEIPSLAKINGMNRDQINDWAAANGYAVNPFKQHKHDMIEALVVQIERRTGKRIS